VGYFLLTGQPVFQAENLVELCQMQVDATPAPPSQRTRMPIPEELEAAILACLEKSRAKRPQTARELAQRIIRCAEATVWNVDEADAWWGRHERGQAGPGFTPPPPTSTRPNTDHMRTIDSL